MNQNKQKSRNDLCRAAEKNAHWVWNTLRKARKLEQQIGEESLTDFFVLNFRQWSPPNFTINTFTRRQEAVTGSDWEWWLGSRGGHWIGMRIQAKVINLFTHRYDHLHYVKKNGTAQVDSLVIDAQKNGLIPFYCLYTYWDTKQQRVLKKVHWSPLRRTEYGAAIVSAHHVQADTQKNKELTHYFKPMIPFAKLFCLGQNANPDFATAVLDNLIQQQIIDTPGNGQRLLRAQPPTYVYDIMNTEGLLEAGELTPAFLDNDRNLRCVTVIQEGANDDR